MRLIIPMRCLSKRESTRIARRKKSPGYSPRRYKEAIATFGWHVRSQVKGDPLIKGEVEVQATLYFTGGRHPDGDNAIGFILDAGNGLLWVDDRLVTTGSWRIITHAPVDKIVIDVRSTTSCAAYHPRRDAIGGET